MKSDLDRLMQENNIDAIWVSGATQNNPDMVYFTGIHHVSSGDLFKIKGQEPVLFYNSMEREEAARTGLKTIGYMEKYPIPKYMEQSKGDALSAYAMMYRDIFKDLDLADKTIAVAGKIELNMAYAIISAIKDHLPNINFAGYFTDSVIRNARLRKSPQEVEHIRKMGKITTTVVGNVEDFLTSCKVKQGHLVKPNGDAVTVGMVKSMIQRWLAELGADNPEETIFAIGRDAGIPHSTGNPDSLLELGKTIVFDIFPCEAGGGYFFDFTRTWSLGYASDEVQKVYEDVFKVHQEMIKTLKVDVPFKHYQSETCRLFSEMGYETIADNPGITEGYVHSLGHGVGLNVQENPFCGMTSSEKDILQTGVVVTVEPGLYYPSKGFGVRIEDTVYLNEQGQIELLAEYPYQLVLPVKE